jgi:DNA polymerase sigma
MENYSSTRNNSASLHSEQALLQKQAECEAFVYEILSREIEKEAEKITTQVNMIKDYRFDIKKQIEKIAIDTFGRNHSNVQANIYGSVATGLALPESDIDIVITGVNSFGNKDDQLANISKLYDNILDFFNDKIMITAKKILQTQIPIIKLTFSLEEYYQERVRIQEEGYEGEQTSKLESDHTALPYIDFDSINSINPHLKNLAVDISMWDSFNGVEHQGIKAANFVESNLNQFPILRSVCLMLKKLLVSKSLNDPYTGGLGSYSLFLMLYAAYFLEKAGKYDWFHSDLTHPARLFTWFLTYFGEYFDYDSQAIIFVPNGIPLSLTKASCGLESTNQTDRAVLCVIDPLNPKNNTTQKAFNIMSIRKLFSETKQKIFREYLQIYSSEEFPDDLSLLAKLY